MNHVVILTLKPQLGSIESESLRRQTLDKFVEALPGNFKLGGKPPF